MAQVTGIGYDSHRFQKGRKLILGGVELEHDSGLAGHSDADVLCHAIIDAILGASGLPDIGHRFPDTDKQWKNASSLKMLETVINEIKNNNAGLIYIDTVIICEKPKIFPYIEKMKTKLAEVMYVSVDRINIKAKTNEKMGFTGRGEGIAVFASATVERLFNV